MHYSLSHIPITRNKLELLSAIHKNDINVNFDDTSRCEILSHVLISFIKQQLSGFVGFLLIRIQSELKSRTTGCRASAE